MIFVDPSEKCSTFYPLVLQFKASSCTISVKNIESSMIGFSPGQTVAYLDCRSKGHSLPWYTICDNTPSIQNHTYMPEGMSHDALSPKS